MKGEISLLYLCIYYQPILKRAQEGLAPNTEYGSSWPAGSYSPGGQTTPRGCGVSGSPAGFVCSSPSNSGT